MARDKRKFIGVILFLALSWAGSLWIRNGLMDYLVDSILVIIVSLLLTYFYYTKSNSVKVLAVSFFVILAAVQVKSVNLSSVYSFDNAENDLQIARMNYYPSGLAKVGFIWETKKQSLYLRKVEENFFNTVDFSLYFHGYFSAVLLPFAIWGILRYFDKPSKAITVIFLASVVALSIVGVNGKYGPFLLFPFIFLFICIAIIDVSGKIRAHG